MKNILWKSLVPFLSLAVFTGFFLPRKESAQEILGKIPVQSSGRVKPFESFAREAILSVTGKPTLEAKDATTVIWKWISNPDEWYTRSFLPVKYEPLAKEFSLMVIGGKISPELALTHPLFQEKVKEAIGKQEKKVTLAFLEKKRLELYDRARLFRAIAQGSLPGFFPHPEDPRAGWIPLEGLADPERRAFLEAQYSPSEIAAVQAALGRLFQAFHSKESENLLESAEEFSLALHHLLESKEIALDQNKIHLEILYNHVRPFQWAWILYLASGIIWFLLRSRFYSAPLGTFLAGFGMHTFGFFLRCQIAARPPVTNMYESIMWVAWGVVLFSVILGFIYRNSALTASAAWVAFLALLVGESFPAVLDPTLSPLVPVLRNNYWLTVHVLTITLSYGAFALSWGLAHANLLSLALRPNQKEEQERLANYLYRALQIGVLLLAAGTILGGVWANDSWGRFWGWDPKETWALIALLGYLVVLHGRFAGWLGSFGTALGAILAFLGILMAWYGVNFVLAAGLHSYGFGGGGLPYVLVAVLVDLIFVLGLVFRYNKNVPLRKSSLIMRKGA